MAKQLLLSPVCQKLRNGVALVPGMRLSKEVWDKVGRWIMVPTVRPGNWPQLNDLETWYLDLAKGAPETKMDGTRSMVMLTAWEIWKERNNRIFNGKERTPDQVLHSIHEETSAWIAAGNKGLAAVVPPSWRQPRYGQEQPR